MFKNVSANITKAAWAAIFIILPLTAPAQDITAFFQDSGVIAGDTIDIPLNVSAIADSDNVISGEFSFSFNEDVIDIIGVNKNGTLLEDVGSVVYYQGTDNLAFASTDTISGTGVLVYLKAVGNPSAAYFRSTNLNITSALFNEGDPSVATENAQVRIQGVRLNPRSNIQIIEGNSLQFQLQEDVVEPVTWSVTDTSIASIDENGLLITKTTGPVRVRAEDARGLKDSTEYFQVQSETLENLTIFLPDVSERQTKTVDIPVNVTDVTGLNITSAELDISFNESRLELREVIHSGTMTEAWGSPTVNIDDDRVRIAGAGTDTLEGTGALFKLRFLVKSQHTGNSTITINSAGFNEDLHAELQNGTFTTLAAPDIEVMPSDTIISIGDELHFEVTGGNGVSPYTWTVSDESIASIDANTGDLEGLSRGDVTVNAFDDDNFPSGEINIRVNDFDAWLDETDVTYPDTAAIHLKTSELSSYNIISYQSEVQYDSTRIKFAGIQTDGTQSKGLTAEVRDSAGVVSIATAGTTFLSGTVPIVTLMFVPGDAVVDGESLELDLQYLEFNEPGPDIPTTTALPGHIMITRTYPPTSPSLVSPAPNASDRDTIVTVDWRAVSGADEYTIQVSLEDQFLTTIVDSTLTGDALTISGLDYETTYFWRVKAANQGGESAWSEPSTFITIALDSSVAEPIIPANDAENVSINPDFKWKAGTGAVSYQIQVSEDLEFNTLVYDLKDITDTTTTVGDLNYLTKYYWRVRASGDDEFSPISSFTTLAEQQDENQTPEVLSELGSIELLQGFDRFVVAKLDTVFIDLDQDDVLNFEILESGSNISAGLSVDSLFLDSVNDLFGDGIVVVQASDDSGETISDTLSYFIEKINAAPQIEGLPDTLSFRSDSTVVLSLEEYISDSDDSIEDLTIEVEAEPSGVSAELNPTDLTLTITAPDFAGDGQITLTISDLGEAATSATLAVIVSKVTSLSNVSSEIPGKIELQQNYPNPFNPSTTISFGLPAASPVKLAVYNMLGQQVQQLVEGQMSAGWHTVDFNATSLSSGVYIYRIEAKNVVQTRIMTLVK